MRARQQPLRRGAGLALVIVVASSGLALIGVGSGYAASTTVVVKPPKGAGPPVAATGVGTEAALDNPRCRTEKEFGVYGKWDASRIGGGPICVVPFKDGADNGGATSRGVTGKSVKVVVVLPSAAVSDREALSAQLLNVATNSKGTWADAIHDSFLANLPFYETWGRDLDVSFFTSTGLDEAAQRADAVAIAAMKPFAVINYDLDGLDILTASLAQKKVVNVSYSVSPKESAAQVPYRWGGGDADAAALASAEVIGKNLVGKKAEYAGEALQATPRKLALVSIQNLIDEDRFKGALAKYKGTIASNNNYVGNGGTFGDATTAQEQAPTLVTRMKDAGVTTVVLFSDVAMIKAMMQQATAQDWYPEWFDTGSTTWDTPILTQSFPKEQLEHTFGIAYVPPYFVLPAELSSDYGLAWFFGPGVGTWSAGIRSHMLWLLDGIHLAGPNLTPKTFRQGLFADPGTKSTGPSVFLGGYGRNTGLPYDAYSPGPADFMPLWMDPHSSGMSFGGVSGGVKVDTVHWYMTDDGRAHRYALGTWPKNLKWFDKSNAINEVTLESSGFVLRDPAPPCAPKRCPSSGAPGPSAGATDPSGFVAKATPNPFAT